MIEVDEYEKHNLIIFILAGILIAYINLQVFIFELNFIPIDAILIGVIVVFALRYKNKEKKTIFNLYKNLIKKDRSD